MIKSLLNMILGCAHIRTTFPLTPPRNSKTPERGRFGTYVVCLDCGEEFDYNWQEMRMGTQTRQIPVSIPGLEAKQRATQ
jgi:hypothetical protein